MTIAAQLMAGKRGLIMGIANERSLAWGIARAVAGQGAELCVTFQGDALKKRVTPLAAEIGCDFLAPADVTDSASMDELFASIEAAGAGSTSRSTPSPSPTRRSSRAAMSTRVPRTSSGPC
jgi:enoyl-[acyl-carrier-protein] reductase (NADH)